MGDKHPGALLSDNPWEDRWVKGKEEESGTRGPRGFSFMCCLEDAFSEVVQKAQKEGRGYFAPALIHLTRATTT